MSTSSARKPRKAQASEDATLAARGADAVAGRAPSSHHNEGHGRRLTAAFEALEAFPALAESRKRVLRVVSQDQPSVAEMVSAIESDVALVIAVMRLANKHADSRGKVRSVPEAIEVLTPAGVEALIGATKTFDFFERTPVWDAAPERFRLHAVATQRAADGLASRVEFPERDELLISSLLHDIGKLVLVQAYPGYPGQVHTTARTPEQRMHAERRELGIDHALVGGVMARRWGLPQPARRGDRAPPRRGRDRRGRASFGWRTCSPTTPRGSRSRPTSCWRSPAASASARRTCARCSSSFPARRRTAAAPPRRARSRRASWRCCKRLAEGKVYKQIALELGLSTSTVRTHLHNVYGKLGAVDRAQAVLIASERGWL